MGIYIDGLNEIVLSFNRAGGPKKTKRAVFRIYNDLGYVQGEAMALELQVGDVKQWRVVGKTASGADAPLDTQDVEPVLSNSNPGALDVSINPDKLSGTFTALSPGATHLELAVDADLDPGETRLISALLDVTVKLAEALTAEFVVS